ncbi:hypothetical protein PABG_04492 [Paracoccidioides brasiliensis Pb03]|nr:hypothetical protein PABG_04492 [Paracoccidioides brasiliensis Pb03]
MTMLTGRKRQTIIDIPPAILVNADVRDCPDDGSPSSGDVKLHPNKLSNTAIDQPERNTITVTQTKSRVDQSSKRVSKSSHLAPLSVSKRRKVEEIEAVADDPMAQERLVGMLAQERQRNVELEERLKVIDSQMKAFREKYENQVDTLLSLLAERRGSPANPASEAGYE